MTFNLHVFMLLAQQADQILHALSSLRQLWSHKLAVLQGEELKWLGAAQHLTDLERLSQCIIDRELWTDFSDSSRSRYDPY